MPSRSIFRFQRWHDWQGYGILTSDGWPERFACCHITGVAPMTDDVDDF